jgi:hypothetical protein
LYYYYASKPTVIQDAETFFNERAQPLTHAQRTAEWFILRAFHLTATMASRIINSANPMDGTTILEMLLSSWFSRTRSTTEMVIGTTNENAILAAFPYAPPRYTKKLSSRSRPTAGPVMCRCIYFSMHMASHTLLLSALLARQEPRDSVGERGRENGVACQPPNREVERELWQCTRGDQRLSPKQLRTGRDTGVRTDALT